MASADRNDISFTHWPWIKSTSSMIVLGVKVCLLCNTLSETQTLTLQCLNGDLLQPSVRARKSQIFLLSLRVGHCLQSWGFQIQEFMGNRIKPNPFWLLKEREDSC